MATFAIIREYVSSSCPGTLSHQSNLRELQFCYHNPYNFLCSWVAAPIKVVRRAPGERILFYTRRRRGRGGTIADDQGCVKYLLRSWRLVSGPWTRKLKITERNFNRRPVRLCIISLFNTESKLDMRRQVQPRDSWVTIYYHNWLILL